MEEQIRIVASPNPIDPMKCTFEIDRPVFPDRSFFFASKERAAGSPLAEQILAIDGVESILVSHDRIEVAQWSGQDWRVLGKEIGGIIRECLRSDVPPISPNVLENVLPPEQIRHVVQQVLDTQINPMVAQHGGVIHLLDVKDNTVFIEMGGGCQGCAMSKATLKNGVERLIREFVPEVGDILDVTDHASGRNPYYAASES